MLKKASNRPERFLAESSILAVAVIVPNIQSATFAKSLNISAAIIANG